MDGQSRRPQLLEFILSVCPPMLQCARDDLQKVLTKESGAKVDAFLAQPEVPCLLVGREAQGESADDIKYRLFMDTEVQYRGPRTCTIAIIKRKGFHADDSTQTDKAGGEGGDKPVVPVTARGDNKEKKEPLGAYLQVINLGYIESEGQTSPFETALNYVEHAMKPLFHSFSTKGEAAAEDDPAKAAEDSKLGLDIVQKRLAELMMSLSQCHQNIEIPEIILQVDLDIKAAYAKAKAEGRKLTVDDFADRIKSEDPAFLSQLQSGVNKWIREIHKVTKLNRDPTTGSAMQEINFWLGMERALNHVQQQLQSPEIDITLTLLKQAKRFLATISFDSDTGLKSSIEKVANINGMMRDFPINELLAAGSIDQMTQATRAIFAHIKKIKNAHQYPLARAFNLVEAVSRDLNTQILRVLQGHRLMSMEYEDFDVATAGCQDLFRVWEDEVRQFKDLVREQVKKRATSERHPAKITCEHTALKERLEDLRKFRRQHQKLREVVSKVLADGNAAYKEINAAYKQFAGVEVLDVSQNGQDKWELAKKQYEDKIDRAEGQITAKLRDKLGTAAMAKSASEMFRVFSKFNALFFRPRIRGAIQEFQSQLIDQVKKDIRNLQNKFREQYSATQAARMTAVRDIPGTSGAIIWARQLERRLQLYMRRVEDVLGKGWEQHIDGQKLKQDGDAFAKKLNAQAIFDAWLNEIKTAKSFDVQGRIFDVQTRQQGRTEILELVVNYDSQICTLFKEVRNLQSMQFRVPYSVKVTSDEAKCNYPFAMTLQESVRTYMQTCSKIDVAAQPLVASYQRDLQALLFDGISLKWDSEKLESYARKLGEQVFLFQHKVDELAAQVEAVKQDVDSLATAPCKGEALSGVLEKIQKTVDELNLANFSNLGPWVDQLDKSIEAILSQRLKQLVQEWVSHFVAWPQGVTEGGTNYIQEGMLHAVMIKNQMLYLNPTKEAARSTWMGAFHQALAMVCRLPKLQAAKYDSLNKGPASSEPPLTERTYIGLLKTLDTKVLADAYNAIEGVLENMEAYVGTWLQYQALWDIDATTLFGRLGEDIEAWQQLLTEIKQKRSSFESVETQKMFGPIVIDYSQVQSKVNAKYDQWHKDTLAAFGTKIQEQLTAFFGQCQQHRFALEKVSNEGGAANVSTFITSIQEIRRKAAGYDAQIEQLRLSQKLLERQRFTFPQEWLYIDRVEGEWASFQQILERKVALMEREIPHLKSQILQQDRAMDEKIKILSAEWSAQKPMQGDINPSQANETLNLFEKRVNSIREEFDRLSKAKEALDMEVSSSNMVEPLVEEVANLRMVWAELSSVHAQLDQLKETPWTAVVPKKIRQNLDDILNKSKAMPAKLRQYEAFEHMQNLIKGYLKVNVVLMDLKTDALKDRHWKNVLQKLRVPVPYMEMSLGHLYEANILKNEAVLKEILLQAQGENALEEFVKQVRDRWTDYELELVTYQNKSKLVRGWDVLFTQIDEHLNSLTSMKLSPYFKVFEEEATAWDEKLNKFRVLFDIWMDVQRRWVYLEGIFFGSADIQVLLPNEYARFRTIDQEFIGLMKKVAAKPKVVDVAAIDGVQRQLDRLADLLSKVQKALGDYLEKQRSQFARFYFVGDEDLLEMIGNSKDVMVVQRHLNKMFAGLTALEMKSDNPDLIIGMSSRENEVVLFPTPIKISDTPAINAWLTKVENAMQNTLANLLGDAMVEFEKIAAETNIDQNAFCKWCDKYPGQVIILACQVDWSSRTDKALASGDPKQLEAAESRCIAVLNLLADQVLCDIEKRLRQKYEQLITEIVHQRDVIRALRKEGVKNDKDFRWLQMMRMYWNSKETDPLKKLHIKMANANFYYGFEYLGIGEKLVQTPLTDKCYLTLTQALHMRLGGNPFGPAGTGKTETVKALGSQLGRFVLVFCCDDTFDNTAVGRILVGLCQVGAWGCFDEFNRLEERILSAVSEQILTIQTGLKEDKTDIELMNKSVKLNSNMGIFVTMNPGYAGRSNLPDNLKQLFREIAMVRPDKELIAQVMLYSQGFRTAERLSGKIVSLFELCDYQLSKQPHYDFGLRSLKSVLNAAGNLKRQTLLEKFKQGQDGSPTSGGAGDEQMHEQNILLRSVCDTLVPKLVAPDIPLLRSLLIGVFPGADLIKVEERILTDEIKRICRLRHLLCSERWMEKVLQLYQIQRLAHGVMFVGPVGSGKSSAWRVLLDAMAKLDGVKGESYLIDPKAVSKDELYGKLDSTTLEWTDGVFTDVLRKILMGLRGEKDKRHWIVFDGDVDPEWAENLNSVLDDNKLLTLPNGERLQIPPNVRIMFEVETLKYATLATVSRCGMVWFSDDVVDDQMIFHNSLYHIKFGDLEAQQRNDEGSDKPQEAEEGGASPSGSPSKGVASFGGGANEGDLKLRAKCVDMVTQFFSNGGFVSKCLEKAAALEHVMVFTKIRVLDGMFSLLRKGIRHIQEYNESHSEVQLPDEIVEKFIAKWLVFSVCWAMGGSMALNERYKYCSEVAKLCTIPLPPGLTEDVTLLDFEVRVQDGEWHPWRNRVPQVDIEPHRVCDADLVIITVDTVRHRACLSGWLEERKPFLLCGPPGSGKTMTLMSTLKALNDFDMASLNFSSGSTPELLLKTFDHYCEYVKTPNGVILRPTQPGKWLMVFCDEINLPSTDKYGTQRVIMFIRQLTEAGGFWRPSDRTWVKLERIQFVGACNPPTDAGRSPMSDRFLRHAPLVYVDFPGAESLKHIFGTFNRAMVKQNPQLRNLADPLTNAMVDFYRKSQKKFTVDMQPHYLYSPRELTRWKFALYEAVKSNDTMTPDTLVRLYVHEGLRIFQDRLVEKFEREWTDEIINTIAKENFPGVTDTTLARPILFSCYTSKSYQEVEREELRMLVQGKLKVFYEEELNVQLVIFDQVLDHITRIDRVLRQPLGHLLLVGASGAGKTVLSKFVSWMNGLSVFQVKAGRNYDTDAFEVDLRFVMKRAGIKGEKITFIFDESNALGPAFLERMNALLAAGEVPGLFEGDEYTTLISECKAAFGGEIGTDESELFLKFTKQVQRNLHIVFTMNPANPDFVNRQATSPALFNRCVIDWFGDWPHDALVQVAQEFTGNLEMVREGFDADNQDFADELVRHQAVANALVAFHEKVEETNNKLMKSAKKYNYVTPRDFLDLIHHVLDLVEEKREEIVEQQRHLNVGLSKLKETEQQVAELQTSLSSKEKELVEKNKLAEDKMQLMVKEQSEAEERKKQAAIFAVALEKKSKEVESRSTTVRAQLAEAEPALLEAKQSVEGIQKKNLDELRALPNPPALVKLALEAVVVMLTNNEKGAVSWDDIKKAMKNPDFIASVIKFDSEALRERTRERITNEYLGNPAWDTDKINRASKAAGPLALWVDSQSKFAMILRSVEPLTNEIKALEKERAENERQLDEAKSLVATLEARIAQYKAEYADLINKVNTIKNEMQSVKSKVDRSRSLLNNLSSEKARWSETSTGFQQQVATMLGDCLLAGAFCTYIGFFDHYYRSKLMFEWREHLDALGIIYKEDLSLIDYLSKPSERLSWSANGLPADDLSAENAIIMKRFIRYPLIIDPSGQATNFVCNEFASKKLMKTSFQDQNFMKNLESALRFGTPLLVQDVDKIDPVLNSVLNKETHKAGGRVLITVGDSDIDFSPTFTMFLATRDPTAQFTPDLCSRVTFVNFTVTPSSLQNQCMNLVLKSERPDVDKKRGDMLKLQGEFRVKIRELEDSLLFALSNVKGNILDDDSVISTLETLKQQAAHVAAEAAQTDRVMEEIDRVSNEYSALAHSSARLFFALEQLGTVHFLYQHSLQFFLDIFHDALRDQASLSTVPKDDYKARLNVIFSSLFLITFKRVSRGLLQADRLVFALRLAQIKADTAAPLGSTELDLLLKGAGADASKTSTLPSSQKLASLLDSRLNSQQTKALQDLHTLPSLAHLCEHMESSSNVGPWKDFLDALDAENKIPAGAVKDDRATPGTIKLREALLTKALRPDRLVSVLKSIVGVVCGPDLMKVPEVNLKELVQQECKPSNPLVLVSAPGFDPSGKITALAAECSKPMTSVAMGSLEGYAVADSAIQSAAKSGAWVLLKNVHLSTAWLGAMGKRLVSLAVHDQFRLFLTMEINPKVPLNLLRISNRLVFEPPAGVKASLQRSYATLLTSKRVDRAPVERCRLHFLLGVLHAIVLERKRYAPVGWTKKYEFSDADQQCSVDAIDYWVDQVSNNGTSSNVDPQKIPWDALRTVLRNVMYGGRIDNEFDLRCLSTFIDQLFCPEAFNSDFTLNVQLQGVESLKGPDSGRSRAHFLEWVETLPSKESPAWLGLPVHAEKMLSANLGTYSLGKWLMMQSAADDLKYEAVGKDAGGDKGKKQGRRGSAEMSNWLTVMAPKVEAMIKNLPAPLAPATRTEELVKNPLFRFYDRETLVAIKLQKRIHSDLLALVEVCTGKAKTTNELRALATNISTDAVPQTWRQYSVAEYVTATEWLADFSRRVGQLKAIAGGGNYTNQSSLGASGKGMWGGGLFFPEAYLTATRQYVAQKFSFSLEDLALVLEIGNSQLDEQAFIISGLTLEGAAWDADKRCLKLTEELSVELGSSRFRWLKKSSPEWQELIDVDPKKPNALAIPVYLNNIRRELVTSVRLKVPNNVPVAVWSQRGVALTLWTKT